MLAVCVLLVARVTDWMLIEGVGVDAHAFVVRIKKECSEAM